jgi:hypothetical protein
MQWAIYDLYVADSGQWFKIVQTVHSVDAKQRSNDFRQIA